jgi:hypothetical protein
MQCSGRARGRGRRRRQADRDRSRLRQGGRRLRLERRPSRRSAGATLSRSPLRRRISARTRFAGARAPRGALRATSPRRRQPASRPVLRSRSGPSGDCATAPRRLLSMVFDGTDPALMGRVAPSKTMQANGPNRAQGVKDRRRRPAGRREASLTPSTVRADARPFPEMGASIYGRIGTVSAPAGTLARLPVGRAAVTRRRFASQVPENRPSRRKMAPLRRGCSWFETPASPAPHHEGEGLRRPRSSPHSEEAP